LRTDTHLYSIPGIFTHVGRPVWSWIQKYFI
jgi:hypothetical protein